ncbi:MAG: hypothetical protein Rubg2KO_23410 [Rubricoccaceae bacterium]
MAAGPTEILRYAQNDMGSEVCRQLDPFPVPNVMRVLALLLLLMPLGAFAQSISVDSMGQIVGLVTEAASGEGLPGANVVLTRTQDGIPSWRSELGTATDIDGHFRVIGIPSAIYTISVSYVGFETWRLKGVEIGSSEHLRFDVALEVDEGFRPDQDFYYYPLISNSPYPARVVTPEFGHIGVWRWW